MTSVVQLTRQRMLPKPEWCGPCPLAGDMRGFSWLEGNGDGGLMVIADSLGENEEDDGLPLRPQGASGRVFRRALRESGLSSQRMTITNLVRCHPPANELWGHPWTYPAIDRCSKYLNEAVEQRRPRVILALGDSPYSQLSADHPGTLSAVRGFVLPSVYGVPMIACVDSQTECLTAGGWRTYSQLQEGQLVAAYNENGKLEWQPLQAVHIYPNTRTKMLHVQAPCLDMMVSEEHDCVVKFPKSRLVNKRQYGIRKVKAKDIRKGHCIPLASEWQHQGGEEPISKELAELLGWYLAEGSPHGLGVRIYQSLKVNPTKCERIEFLLNQVKAEYSLRESRANALVFTVVGEVGRQIRALCHKKMFPVGFLLWSRSLLLAFYQGLHDGDGSNSKQSSAHVWTQKDPQRIADFQALCARLGWTSSLQRPSEGNRARHIGVYFGNKSRWRSIHGKSKAEWAYYTGLIWCPQTPSGTWVARRNGKVFITGNSYHPSYIARGAWKLYGAFKRDVAFAAWCAANGVPEPLETDYALHPGLDDVRTFLDYLRANPALPVSYDVETVEILGEPDAAEWANKRLIQIQFSIRLGHAIVLPWADQYIELATAILALPNPKWGWNSRLSDDVVLEANGCVIGGERHDLMLAWAHAQPDFASKGDDRDGDEKGIPSKLMGLQSAASFYCPEVQPWKHLSAQNLQLYGAFDADYTMRCGIGIFRELEALGLMAGYREHKYELRWVLDDLGEHGLPVDRQRQAELRTYALAELSRLQLVLHARVPASVLSIHPKAGYKALHSKVEVVVGGVPGEKVALKAILSDYDADSPPIVTAAGHTGYIKRRFFPAEPLEKVVEESVSMYEAGARAMIGDERWCIERLYNPHASSPNTKDYIRAMNYRMPTDLNSGKDTTGRNELKKLAKETGDEVLSLTDQWRELRKTGLDYTTGKWVPGDDGRVHGTFKCGTTGSGQTSCTDPNLQQFPEHSGIAKRAKEAVRAEPGHLFVKCVSPQTRLLMADLTWRRAGEVQTGEELIAFDESPVKVNRKGRELLRPSRYLRRSRVLSTANLHRPSVKIHTNKGTVICSTDHRWLCRLPGQLSKLRWVQASDVVPGTEIAFFTWPWDVDTSWEAGWLAGFMDGEGYVRGSKADGNHRGAGFGQNDGLAANYATELVEKRGFRVSKNSTQRTTQLGPSKCSKFEITGHAFAWLRFLGMVRPKRLLNAVIPVLDGMSYWGRASSAATVIAVHDVGDQAVVAIETSTHTYIAEGMLSHNCDMRGFHSRAIGWLANDPLYYELADYDVHSFITAHFLNLHDAPYLMEMGGSERRAALEAIKHEHGHTRNYKVKRVTHGRQFNMGVRKLYDMHAENFNPSPEKMIELVGESRWYNWDRERQIRETAKLGRREATKLFHLFDELFPETFVAFPAKISTLITEDSKWRLVSQYAHHRYFWNYDLEQATAFLPSNSAHCHIQSALIRLRRTGALRAFGGSNFTHDALWLHTLYERVGDCVVEVQREFEAPSLVLTDSPLGPFQCNSDAEVGPDLANMVSYNNWVSKNRPTAEEWPTVFPAKEAA